ncbi:hypothetical protein LX59_00481 [Azomonas agilis]|uniref:Uncharacterized protein n=1 Tax=Azomonas agilis TaxID=116849 RepID=A0A562J0U4_9GAMM|nr:BrnT family toxin [Azomonas agilis]TWH76444.1 hypothetical protein LX59_00481 [Azomonas agilis]
MAIDIEFDPAKAAKALEDRGLDFSKAGQIFQGKHLTRRDDRADYGEDRYNTVGWYEGRLVFVTWTPRGQKRRIISMRHTHEKEQRKIRHLLG